MLVELFIPLADNDGLVFGLAHHRVFEERLLDVFGGFTRRSDPIKGAWIDNGRIYQDDLVIYVVRLESITLGSRVREAVEFAKAHYEQEAIFVSYLGLSEVL